MRRRQLLHSTLALGLLGVGLLGSAACLSPTVPLPPPSMPSIFQGAEEGTVELASNGGALPNAIIVVYNGSPDLPLDRRVNGAQADDRGSWRARAYARGGDLLEITQEVGEGRSQTLAVRVPAGPLAPIPASLAPDAGAGAATDAGAGPIPVAEDAGP